MSDALLSPPKTKLDTGNWDAQGPLSGWRAETDTGNIQDSILEDTWTHNGLTCVLLRVTEYIVLSRRRGSDRIGESETFYRGYVHAPGVESLPKGCYGTTIVDCYPEHNWFVWDERGWSNGYHRGKTVSETARRKTNRLADAAHQKQKDTL